jgi:hypothetical protein
MREWLCSRHFDTGCGRKLRSAVSATSVSSPRVWSSGCECAFSCRSSLAPLLRHTNSTCLTCAAARVDGRSTLTRPSRSSSPASSSPRRFLSVSISLTFNQDLASFALPLTSPSQVRLVHPVAGCAFACLPRGRPRVDQGSRRCSLGPRAPRMAALRVDHCLERPCPHCRGNGLHGGRQRDQAGDARARDPQRYHPAGVSPTSPIGLVDCIASNRGGSDFGLTSRQVLLRHVPRLGRGNSVSHPLSAGAVRYGHHMLPRSHSQ